MLFRLTLILCLFALSACGTDPGKPTIHVHDVYLECDGVNDLCNNATAGKRIYVGLSQDMEFDCVDELEALSPNLFQAKFDYSGVAIAEYDGTSIYGTVTQWANSSGAKVLTFVDTDYKLCAFIDSDENGTHDANELVVDQLFHPYDSIAPITAWTLP